MQENIKNVTITIDEEVHEKAKKDAKRILGKTNFSGYVTYLINKEE